MVSMEIIDPTLTKIFKVLMPEDSLHPLIECDLNLKRPSIGDVIVKLNDEQMEDLYSDNEQFYLLVF
jgi:hypothetical protein